jgi:uncharacterized peroxidase-related enzyme
MMAYPDTGDHLIRLVEALLRGPSPLTAAEREVIAAYVSAVNGCRFCTNAHAATARHLLGPSAALLDQLRENFHRAPISDKLKALLLIAVKVLQGGRRVRDEDVARAREAGADDRAIHDTVLIAAAFCMFNRYVDGLGTWAPEEPAAYERIGADLARNGYVNGIRQAM